MIRHVPIPLQNKPEPVTDEVIIVEVEDRI